jgi:hypothetical protein
VSDTCDICRRDEDFVGYAAVPGAAVTVGWCRECLDRRCQPMFAVEAALCYMDPEKNLILSLEESVAKMRAGGIEPVETLADWFLDEQTYKDGEYLTIRALLERMS